MSVIETHIHFWPASHITNGINWMSESNQGPLYRQYCANEYMEILPTDHGVKGYVFVEADRRYDEKVEEDWKESCREYEYACEVAHGGKTNVGGEGFTPENAKLILGYVGWAPVNRGKEACEKYLQQLNQVKHADPSLLKGFRYLVQDKPDGSFIQDKFVEGVQWCGKKGYHFEICLDYQSRGKLHIEESVQLAKKVNADPSNQTVIVVDHMGKPDLRVKPDEIDASPIFQAWKKGVEDFASTSNVYMKLSGMLSYLPPLSQFTSPQDILPYVVPYVKVVLDAFGKDRIIWGSDWPVLVLNNRKEEGRENWGLWKEVASLALDQLKLSSADKEAIFSGNAVKVYRL